MSLYLSAKILRRCRGLKVLVELLDEDYSQQKDLVIHALSGIGSVFELQVGSHFGLGTATEGLFSTESNI